MFAQTCNIDIYSILYITYVDLLCCTCSLRERRSAFLSHCLRSLDKQEIHTGFKNDPNLKGVSDEH